MSNERYWIFHEWVRSNYILPDGYMPKVWDSLAFYYWFNEKDDYYLQFENKTKEDNEIDLHIGESVYDMPLVAWLLKNAPLYHNGKNDREGFNNNYHLSQYAQSQQKNAPRVQQTYRGSK